MSLLNIELFTEAWESSHSVEQTSLTLRRLGERWATPDVVQEGADIITASLDVPLKPLPRRRRRSSKTVVVIRVA